MTERAAIAARVSTQEQADSRLGLDSQLHYCTEAATREQLQCVAEPFIDDGVSGGMPLAQRPAGARLCAAIEAGEIDTVIALDQSRLFRSALDMLATLEHWTELGVRVLLVDGGWLNFADDEGWYAAGIRALTDDYFRRKTRTRTKRALAQLKTRGRSTGPAPYGYSNVVEYDSAGERVNRGAHEINETEYRVVMHVHDMAKALKPNAIARLLNEGSVPTRLGGKWSAMQVQRILARPLDREAAQRCAAVDLPPTPLRLVKS